MVQFLSVIFFSWISSIFVGFFKSSRFFVSSCMFQTQKDNGTWLQRVYTCSSSFLGWQNALFMTNTKHLLNTFDSFKTNYPHFYLYVTSGWVLQGLRLRGCNPSPSKVLLHVGSHVRNIALQLFAELWTNAHWASSHSVSRFELRQARFSSDCAARVDK